MEETSGSAESHIRRPSRARGSSSTISVVKRMDLHDFPFGNSRSQMVGKHHGDDHASHFVISHTQLGGITVKLLQSSATIRQANATPIGGLLVRKAGAIIF